MNMKNGDIFYKPQDAWAADFIPYYHNGKFQLFFLKDWRNNQKHGEGTPWWLVRTDDFVHFEDLGEILPRGSQNVQDLYVFTGSVIEANGLFHIFYTGHNPYFPKEGKRLQGIMHAVSPDLHHWNKIPEDTFYAPQSRYEPHDWRDPFVFWNEEAGAYWMLAAARLNSGPSRRRGCIALCTSQDLKTWDVVEPFWAPNLYHTHECPDLFKIGDWWYLVYSTFTERWVTHYRMSRSLGGPWTAPDNDTFDGRAYYAAKTAGDGQKRYTFGWNPTKNQEKDYSTTWNWGGNLVVHEIVQSGNGYLSVKMPESICKAFSQREVVSFTQGIGNWHATGNQVRIQAPDSFACAVAGPTPERGLLVADLTIDPGTRGCGLLLRSSDDFEKAYYIRLEPGRNRLVFDSWPKPASYELSCMYELERPVDLTANQQHNLKAIISDTICVVYLDNQIAMSTRLYDLKEGRWGVFVNEGSVSYENISQYTNPQ